MNGSLSRMVAFSAVMFVTAMTGTTVVLAVETPSTAVTAPAKPSPAPAAALPASPPSTPVEAKSDGSKFTTLGFRSAKFGMSEPEVRSAIAKDFGTSPDAVKSSTNPTEQTQLLTLKVPDLLPGGGVADVAYVFGYKSKKLIQINIVWSKSTDPKMTAERLYSNAEILRSDFAEKSYRPESIQSEAAVKNGILMFRGEDADNRVTALILQGAITAEKEEKKLTPSSLLLFYTADAKHPDIFKLAPGQF